MLPFILLSLLILNIGTCTIVRLAWGGKFTYNKKASPLYNGKNILIGGLMSQPDDDFAGISELPYQMSLMLRYSVLGFNPKNAGRQIRELAKRKDVLIANSIGCKALAYSRTNFNERAFINPLSHSIILDSEYQLILEFLGPILEVIMYLLGWIAVIPFVKTGKNSRYSLALIADQLYFLQYGDPSYEDLEDLEQSYLLLSIGNEHVQRDIAISIYENVKKYRSVPIRSVHISNPDAASVYGRAIKELLVH